MSILTKREIKKTIKEIVVSNPQLNIKKVKLFGSYANDTADEKSDINLAICEPKNIDVLSIYAFEDIVKEKTKKEVHAIRIEDAKEENKELYEKIVNEGVEIYASKSK